MSVILVFSLMLCWDGSDVFAQAVSTAQAQESKQSQSPAAHRTGKETKAPAAESNESANTPAEPLPFRQQSVISAATLIRVVVVTLIGLALVIAVVYGLKRILFVQGRLPSGDSHMQLIEVKRLSQRLTLFMVRVDNKTVVLAQSGDQLVMLDLRCAIETSEEGDDLDET